MSLQRQSPKAEVQKNIYERKLTQENQKEINKQIESHKARQAEIAQGTFNSFLRPLSLEESRADRKLWKRSAQKR